MMSSAHCALGVHSKKCMVLVGNMVVYYYSLQDAVPNNLYLILIVIKDIINEVIRTIHNTEKPFTSK